jgi:hypothetical protein
VLVHEDPDLSGNERIQELEIENQMLRSKIASLECELMSRSPTKKTRPKKNTIPIIEPSFDGGFASGESDVENVLRKMDYKAFGDGARCTSSTPKPPRKPRKMTARKRDFGPEDEL